MTFRRTCIAYHATRQERERCESCWEDKQRAVDTLSVDTIDTPESRRWSEHREAWKPRRNRPARSTMEHPPEGCPRIPGLGYLYVVEFSTGIVKIGTSVDPGKRWRDYLSDAYPLGVRITRMWVSPAHRNYRLAERELIRFCTSRGPARRGEYFEYVAYADAVAYASVLPEWADRRPQTGQENAK